MTFKEAGSLSYYMFDSLAAAGVSHAVFTRQGGASPAPWDSLNVGGTVGDERSRVAENLRRALQAAGRSWESVYDVWQVHGRKVVCAQAPRPAGEPYRKADAILTSNPDVTLFMRFADCVPILLYDPIKQVVGLVHAGWQGTVKRVAAAALKALQDRYDVDPKNILAGIGPSIGPHHYPVGSEVITQVRAAFGPDAGKLILPLAGSPHGGRSGDGSGKFDLWEANRMILAESGVQQIEIAGLCTACDPGRWYSHRGEAGETGRFGVLIAL